MRKARHQATADRIADIDKYDRRGSALPLQGRSGWRAFRHNHIRRSADQFHGVHLHSIWIAGSPAIVDVKVEALLPPQLVECLAERFDAQWRFRIVLGKSQQHADPTDAIGLLRTCGDWPRKRRRGHRTAE